jgi:hypothetical protein
LEIVEFLKSSKFCEEKFGVVGLGTGDVDLACGGGKMRIELAGRCGIALS